MLLVGIRLIASSASSLCGSSYAFTVRALPEESYYRGEINGNDDSRLSQITFKKCPIR